MTSVAVVYHSGYGHTAVLADNIAKGVEAVAGASASLFKAEDFPSQMSDPGQNWRPQMQSFSVHPLTWAQPLRG